MVQHILIVQDAEDCHFLLSHPGSVIIVKRDAVSRPELPSIDFLRNVVACGQDIVTACQLVIVRASLFQILPDPLYLFFGQQIDTVLLIIFIPQRKIKLHTKVLDLPHLFHSFQSANGLRHLPAQRRLGLKAAPTVFIQSCRR